MKKIVVAAIAVIGLTAPFAAQPRAQDLPRRLGGENGPKKAADAKRPAPKLADGTVEHRLQSGSRHRLIHRASPLGGRQLTESPHKIEVLRNQHFDVERIVFGEIAEPAFGLASGIIQVDAVEPDGPGVRLDELGDHAHGGGLAGAIGPEEAYHLAAIHLEGDLIDGGDTAESLGNPVEGK